MNLHLDKLTRHAGLFKSIGKKSSKAGLEGVYLIRPPQKKDVWTLIQPLATTIAGIPGLLKNTILVDNIPFSWLVKFGDHLFLVDIWGCSWGYHRGIITRISCNVIPTTVVRWICLKIWYPQISCVFHHVPYKNGHLRVYCIFRHTHIYIYTHTLFGWSAANHMLTMGTTMLIHITTIKPLTCIGYSDVYYI